jgi:phosphoglycolate phosphatase-like HAD superfamily hydrolase
MIRRIALFDIDGTLLHTRGRAVEALLRALGDVYGAAPENDGYLMDGKTELRIVHELLAASGHERGTVEAGLPRFWTRYAETLKECIHFRDTHVYKGVRELITRLRERGDIALGVLTGNCPAAARIKLEAAGLDGDFGFGAFGESHEQREDLAGLALEAARKNLGIALTGRAVSVLGDTPNDIRCARPLGLRAIAVATGRYGAGELEPHRPDYLFADFSNGAAVEAAILAE